MEGGDKSAGGRPLKFDNVYDLQVAIDDYFASCEEEMWREEEDSEGALVWRPVFDHKGNIRKVMSRPPTLSGLAVHLGVDRRTLLNYANSELFFPTVKAAKARIETFTEELLLTTKSAAGVIFNLKNNYGWVDKTEQDVNANVNVNKLEDLMS